MSPVATRIFLAGATGAIGRRLLPLLLGAGCEVTGTTRRPEKAAALAALGVRPVVVDIFDGEALTRALAETTPDVLIHQLTDLPQAIDPATLPEALRRNARLRSVGTPILMRAAQAAGVRRAVVQSICFVYRAGPMPYAESAPLESPSVSEHEAAALGTPGVDGIVLRYGRLWGPGTWAEKPDGLAAPLHVDAAAHAALLAISRGAPGIYNIAEEDGTVLTEKARRELGFDPLFRLEGR